MGKFRYMKTSEVSSSRVTTDTADMWLRVSYEYDLYIGVIPVIRGVVCPVSGITFDMVMYARDKHRNRIGVFVAAEGKVGWSLVHPRDFKGRFLNWDMGRDLAWYRAFYYKLDADKWLPKVPMRIRSQFRHFVKHYWVWYEKNNLK